MTTSCIIPFFNEGTNRLFPVLEQVIKIRGLDEIILVDDGSINDISLDISSKFKNIKLIRLSKNLGKSGAVHEGLKIAKGEDILLLDADLTGLKKEKLDKMILSIANPKVDMILLRYDEKWYIKMFGVDLSLSGIRILRKKDLEEVFKQFHPYRYQLEVAINRYMIKNKKKVYFLESAHLNQVKKINKIGILKGVLGEVKMASSLAGYIGPLPYLYQLYFFGRKKLNS